MRIAVSVKIMSIYSDPLYPSEFEMGSGGSYSL